MVYTSDISYEELCITIRDFESFLEPDEESFAFVDELNEIITLGKELVEARGILLEFEDIQVGKNDFSINGVVFDCKSKIARQLINAQSLALFACSAGEGINKQYKAYTQEGEYLKGYFVDMLGNIAVEKAMDIIQKRFQDEKEKENQFISNRYSPGYCGWVLKEQPKIFSLMPLNPCGITLTESCLMIPSKSISGVIGIGKDIRFTAHQCSACELKSCLYRRNQNKA
jgi:hypothetical protein